MPNLFFEDAFIEDAEGREAAPQGQVNGQDYRDGSAGEDGEHDGYLVLDGGDGIGAAESVSQPPMGLLPRTAPLNGRLNTR